MSGGARRILSRVIGSVLLVSLLVAGALAFMHRQDISDFLQARQYDPPADIVELTETLDLTGTGERVFFASHPTLEASQEFNDQCSQVDHSEQGHVLGCFSGERIHLFAVDEERLNGIVEVTAAHELLHAAYSRLGTSEREALAAQLRSAYEEIVEDDEALEERMEVYKHLSQTAFANELHSVLGTEVRELPDQLEQHYERWFNDRAGIVELFDSYHSVFTELQERAEALQEELSVLREDIQQRSSEYDSAVEEFNTDSAEFQNRNEAYEFSDDEAGFYRIYNELEERRTGLEQTLADLQADIDRYNELREELSELSEISNELEQQMDSELAPPATRPDE